MKSFTLPGVFWVAVFVAVVPAVAGVIEQFYPAAQYPAVVAVLAGLAAVAKSLELALTKQQPEPLVTSEPGAPVPAAAPLAPSEPSPTTPFWFELLFGRR